MKIDIEDATQKYDILYTDPPWMQGRGGKKAARPKSTGMSVPYQTMTLPEILEIHRKVATNLMNEKHNIFMWTIDKYLPETEEIMRLLGYQVHAACSASRTGSKRRWRNWIRVLSAEEKQ